MVWVWWFGFLGSDDERDCYLAAPLESQPTNPKHQFTNRWLENHQKKQKQKNTGESKSQSQKSKKFRIIAYTKIQFLANCLKKSVYPNRLDAASSHHQYPPNPHTCGCVLGVRCTGFTVAFPKPPLGLSDWSMRWSCWVTGNATTVHILTRFKLVCG